MGNKITAHCWTERGRTGATISNVSDYQMAPTQTKNLTCNFYCYCSYTGTAQLMRRVFHFDISISCQFRVNRVFFCVLWSWRSWWNSRMGQEIPQRLMYRYSWRPSLSPRTVYSTDEDLVLKKNYGPLTTLLKCWIIRICELLDIGLKGFDCYQDAWCNCEKK